MEKSTNRALKLNLIMGFFYPVVMLVVNFLSKQAIQRVLGTEYQGIQTVYSNFCDVFAFAFIGVGLAMTYHLYKPILDEDEEKIAAIYNYFARSFKIIAAITLGVGIIATALVMWSLNTDVSSTKLIMAYYIYLVGVVISGVSRLYYCFLIAYQKLYVSRIIFCISELVAVAAELIVLYLVKSYIVFLLVILAKCLASIAVYFLYTKIKFGFIFKTIKLVDSAEKKQIRLDIKDMIITRAGQTLVSCTDTILASGLVSTFVAGCYSNYYFIFYGLTVFAGAFFDSFMAKIGRMIAKDNKKESFEYLVKISAINIIVAAVLTCGCYILSDSFITLWMDESVLLPHSISVIVSLNLFMACIRYASAEFRQAAGLFDKASIFILVRGIANVVLSVVLGIWLGLLGILLATAITFAATIYWYEPYVVLKYFGKKMYFELIYQFAGIVMAISSIWFTKLIMDEFPADTWFLFIAKACLVVLVSAAWCAAILGIVYAVVKFFKSKREVNG